MTKEQALEALTSDILAGRMKPGQPLAERTLAERFGLSRTPIREVLLRLEAEHLVEAHPNHGVFVRKITVEDVKEVFQLRISLEPLAASLAAHGRPQPDVKVVWEELVGEEAVSAMNPTELSNADAAFHEKIIAWSGNNLLAKMHTIIHKQSILIRRITQSHLDIGGTSFEEHRRILSAVEDGDAAGAHDEMRSHLERSYSEALNLLLKLPA